jgi:hypothetical protein
LGYPLETIDIILIIAGGLVSVGIIIAGFASGDGAGVAAGAGALVFLLILGGIGFLLGRNTYVVDLPVNVLASNMTFSTVVTDTTDNIEVYNKENIEWKVVEKKIPRDKAGNLIPGTTVQLSFKLKYPKTQKDHEYQLTLPVHTGQFTATLVYTVYLGKAFKTFEFEGVE